MPRVSVLIPHHRNAKLLEPLFTSLLAMDMNPRRVEYVLVDNGATDGSVDFVRRRFPQVKILALGRNEGFAPALNRAARVFESAWLCFLNNDVRVDVDWLSNLMYAARQIDAPCFA
ncbi:MAG: glycosyltransferase family 2 protein, partial [Candidatus Hinthialibacter sp.]